MCYDGLKINPSFYTNLINLLDFISKINLKLEYH